MKNKKLEKIAKALGITIAVGGLLSVGVVIFLLLGELISLFAHNPVLGIFLVGVNMTLFGMMGLIMVIFYDDCWGKDEPPQRSH